MSSKHCIVGMATTVGFAAFHSSESRSDKLYEPCTLKFQSGEERTTSSTLRFNACGHSTIIWFRTLVAEATSWKTSSLPAQAATTAECSTYLKKRTWKTLRSGLPTEVHGKA